MRKQRFDTLAVGAGYGHADAAAAGGPICEPVYLTSAEHFESAEDMRAALNGERDAWIYSRLGNPTVGYLERTVAALEGYDTPGEVSAAAASSGMAAVTLATSPFLAGVEPGMNIVASSACYGATYMIFAERYGRERGVDVRWVRDSLSIDEWASKIDGGTRFVYAESPANPVLDVVDIGALSQVAHAAGVPLIIDSTMATPALLRPLSLGADIVVSSLGKTVGASGASLGGAVVARHGLTSTRSPAVMTEDFAGYLRRGPLRDMGAVLSPFNAFTILGDIRELRGRVDAMSRSAGVVAERLAASDRVAEVIYPGLAEHPSHKNAQAMVLVDSELDGDPVHRYGPVLGFRPVGGVDAAFRVLDRFGLVWRANDLGRVRSAATIPAIATHKQIADSDPDLARVAPDLIRLSVGLEHIDDLLDDIVQAVEGA